MLYLFLRMRRFELAFLAFVLTLLVAALGYAFIFVVQGTPDLPARIVTCIIILLVVLFMPPRPLFLRLLKK